MLIRLLYWWWDRMLKAMIYHKNDNGTREKTIIRTRKSDKWNDREKARKRLSKAGFNPIQIIWMIWITPKK